jgi:hypothetical protein
MENGTTEALRRRFADAFDGYAREGVLLRDLLFELEAPPKSQRLWDLNKQQDRLDHALRDYNEARQAYMFHLLRAFVRSE